MTFQDFVLETPVKREDLEDALATAFGVAPAGVRVVDAIENAPAGALVLGQISPVCGEFSILLSTYVRLSAPPPSPAQIANYLALRLGMRVLMPDLSMNPYSMVLFEGQREPKSVSLDPEKLDSNGEYVLSGTDLL